VSGPLVDGATQGWWDATRERRLVVQRCEACGHHQHYPRPLCLACSSTEVAFVDAVGTGHVHSFTVVHRAPTDDFTPPYVVALVRLAEGPVLMSNIVGCDPEEVRCEMPVRVDWRALDDGRHLPVFQAVDGGRA
jgi:uncharacterized protein